MLCLATATHNIKWVKITHICLFWDQKFAVWTHNNSLPITVILSANKQIKNDYSRFNV